MKTLKAIGTTLFLCVLGFFFILFIGIGMAVLALGDLLRFLGRRKAEKMRGMISRGQRNGSKEYHQPYLVMDADGFVEPPARPAFTDKPAHYGHGSNARSASTVPSASRRVGGLGSFVPNRDCGPKILYFPADPAVRERLKASRRRSSVTVATGDNKVIYFPRSGRLPKF